MMNRLFKPLFESVIAGSGVRIGGDRPWDIRVNRDRLYRRALRGSLGIGESYIDGDWDCDALDEMFRRVLSSNIQHRPLFRAAGWFKELRSRLTNLQTRRRSQAVAEEHYDLDHRMYALFLGPWNQYTCCFFDGTNDLERAEVLKLEMLCDKLELKAGDRLLDIGCGWGGFAKYAAQTRGCEVTGISLYESQVPRLFKGDRPMGDAVRAHGSKIAALGGVDGLAERYWAVLRESINDLARCYNLTPLGL